MVLELHVWGPAFSLPSIDAQCLAAIAYFTQALPKGEWVVVASSPSVSPTNELPALRNENVWVSGFRNILFYLRELSEGKWDLDADLEGLEKADCIAFSSFVESQGQPLIDLSLYVSSENYTATTRPIYSSIQCFPLPYITPPALRAAAKARTEHLGLSSLDIDSTSETEKKEPSIIPESLRKPKHTVSSALSSSPSNAAQIRLDSLATSFFTPLQSLVGNNRYLLNSSPTSLDCLALGYLALCLLPDLPSPWLANSMRKNFPQLCAYVHVAQLSFFGGPQTLVDAGLASDAASKEEEDRANRARGKSNLPWQKADTGGLLEIGKILGSTIVDSIPIISSFRQPLRPQKEGEKSEEEQLEEEAWKERLALQRRELLVNIGSVVAGLGLFVGFMLQQGFLKLLTAPPGKRNAQGLEAVGADGEGEDEEVHIENPMVDRVTPGIQALANMMTLGDDVLMPQGRQAQSSGQEQ